MAAETLRSLFAKEFAHAVGVVSRGSFIVYSLASLKRRINRELEAKMVHKP